MKKEVIQEYGNAYKTVDEQNIADIKAEFYSYTPLEFERTPLMEAAKNGHLNICEYLITCQNACVDIKSNDHWTAIMYAAFNNHTRIVQLLIDHNTNIRLQDKNGDDVANLVARHGYLDIMKRLLDKDHELASIRGSQGCTPLIRAARSGHYNICKYLVEEMNVDVNIQDDNRKSAIQWAISNNDKRIAELLVSNGAIYHSN